MTRRLWAGVRIAFAALGFAFIAFALRDALRDPDLAVLPSVPAMVVAVVAVVAGLWSAVVGWAVLLGEPVSRTVARGFLVAQLGKYIPGGVWQVVGQVGHASAETDAGGQRASLAFLAAVAAQVAAGMLVGLPVAAVAEVSVWVRAGVVVGAVGALAVVLNGPLLLRLLQRVPWIGERLTAQDAMPPRRAMLLATATSVFTMGAAAIVFVIAYAAPSGDYRAVVGPAYAVAWTIGFLALPFPAGLGVREAALLLLVPGGSSTALVAASAVARVLYIVGEVISIGTSFLLRPGAALATTATVAADDDPSSDGPDSSGSTP